MSVRGTLLSIFGVTIAAFGLITWLLFKSIADFSAVQAYSAIATESLGLYMDLTVHVGRYVKEGFDAFDGDKSADEDRAKSKAECLRRLEQISVIEHKLAIAGRAVRSTRRHDGAYEHLPEVRALFEEVVRQVEATSGSDAAGDEAARKRLQEALEESYDRGFLTAIDRALKDERDRARESVEIVLDIATEVKVKSALAAGATLLALMLLVGSRLRSMAKGIRLLLEGSERLAAGDLERRIPELGRHELGQIGAAFNRMAVGLLAAQSAKIRAERLAAVGQAAASVGHDLRNPLGAIHNAVYYLKRRVTETELRSDARVEKFFGVIDRELTTSKKIISDLLDFARERRLNASACPLRALIADAISVLQPPRPMQIENNVPEDLPVINVDKDQLRQALVNLLQNATEAVPETREGRVVAAAEASEDAVTLSITDNGDGIPDEQRAQIFEPFFTTKTKGTGLGLAITAGIVRRHKGDIEVQSEPGRSTTFLIRLPRVKTHDANALPDQGDEVP